MVVASTGIMSVRIERLESLRRSNSLDALYNKREKSMFRKYGLLTCVLFVTVTCIKEKKDGVDALILWEAFGERPHKGD